MIRKSTENDKEQIKHLIKLCFGDREDPYENLNDRYYLYFENDALVAMTGLTSKSPYGHLEIDWTCTLPEYRHNGHMQKLFKEMLKEANDKVYCSCWRLSNNDKVNLHTLMDLFNFKEIINCRVHWKCPHNCSRGYIGGCSNYTGNNCECYEDLYLYEPKGQEK